MPIAICAKCGHATNTAFSQFFNREKGGAAPEGTVHQCYARLSNNKWEIGCSYNEADDFMKNHITNIIKNQDDKTPLQRGLDAMNEILQKQNDD